MCHHTQLIFSVFFVKMGFHHVGQNGLDLLTSSDPPASASQSSGMTGVSHRAQLQLLYTRNYSLQLAFFIPSVFLDLSLWMQRTLLHLCSWCSYEVMATLPFTFFLSIDIYNVSRFVNYNVLIKEFIMKNFYFPREQDLAA